LENLKRLFEWVIAENGRKGSRWDVGNILENTISSGTIKTLLHTALENQDPFRKLNAGQN
jgi:hypothetical protein